jgi:hypothetical protein
MAAFLGVLLLSGGGVRSLVAIISSVASSKLCARVTRLKAQLPRVSCSCYNKSFLLDGVCERLDLERASTGGGGSQGKPRDRMGASRGRSEEQEAGLLLIGAIQFLVIYSLAIDRYMVMITNGICNCHSLMTTHCILHFVREALVAFEFQFVRLDL